jgi:hypothetical protein
MPPRLLAPVAALLLGSGLPLPAAADPLPAAVTPGTVYVSRQVFRCTLYGFELTGSFRVGVRSWHGTAGGALCTRSGNDPSSTLSEQLSFTLDGSSADGYFRADCTTNLNEDPFLNGDPQDPALFDCRASINGVGLLPLVFEMKTHPAPTDPASYYEIREGSFYGL